MQDALAPAGIGKNSGDVAGSGGNCPP